MKPTRVIWATIVVALLFGACGDKGGKSPERDGPYGSDPLKDAGSDKPVNPGGDDKDSGSMGVDSGMDGGTSGPDASMMPPTKRNAKVVSVAPPYGVAGEPYGYSPKSDQAGDTSWSVKSGPVGLTVDEKSSEVQWTPTKEQSGKHEVVLEGKSGEKAVTQTYEVTVAVSQKEAAGAAEPKESGQVTVSSPKSDIQGTSIYTPKGAVKEQTDLTISKLDKAPPMNNVKGESPAVQFGPSGTVFQTPALVALPLAKNAVLDASRIGAFVYNPAGRWERVPVVRVDLDNRLVYARASHFSTYQGAESALSLQTSLTRMGSSSACEGRLVGRASLQEGLSAVSTESINNLPKSLTMLAASGIDDLASLISHAGVSGSLRIVRVLSLQAGSADERLTVESQIATTTLYLPGDGRAKITHTKALGAPIQVFEFTDVTASLSDIEGHLRGLYTDVHFSADLTGPLSLSASMHAVYFPEDVSLDPTSAGDLGIAVVDAPAGDPSEPSSESGSADVDCDTLNRAVDSLDNRLLARIVPSPADVVSTVVGATTRLTAALVNAPAGTLVSFEELNGFSSMLAPVDGEPSSRDFVATAAGRYIVEARANVAGEVLRAAFVIDVAQRKVLPKCTPAPEATSMKLGESVVVHARVEGANDVGAFMFDWGVLDENRSFTAFATSSSLPSTLFTPASAGAFEIACRVSDGVTTGALGTANLGVLAPDQNRAPTDFLMSPPSATIAVGETLKLTASASDPDDGDTLSFVWSAPAGTLAGATSSATKSENSFTASAAGLYEVSVSVSDGEAPPEVQTATVLVVADKATFAAAADADNDGWPAGAAGTGLDCDDNNPKISPAAKDACGDNVDDDCDGVARASDCDDDGVSEAQGDCNDLNAAIHPGAFEYCDGINNDCDQLTDENAEGVVVVGNSCSVGLGACAAKGKLACAVDAINTVCTAPVILPKAEICNGIDDNCDGRVPVTETDDDQDGLSECTGDCDDTRAFVRPGALDVCDAVDNDCDATLDEDFAPESTVCGIGACAASGRTSCSNGEVVNSCKPGVGTESDTTCDGVDDNCNGRTDESYQARETVCGQGVCARSGLTSCVAGKVQDSCTIGEPLGSDSDCNNVDEDCDGTPDDGFVGKPTSCGFGVCARSGLSACVSGKVIEGCTPGPSQGEDTNCNNIDEDCDGTPDDGFVGTETSCGQGVCARGGLTSCLAGKVQDSCRIGEPSGSDNDCNNVDEDCDGTPDDGFVGTPTSCGSGVCARSGMSACVSGKVSEGCSPGPIAGEDANCNALDEDCDGVADDGFVAADTTCGQGACFTRGKNECVSGKLVDSCLPLNPTTNTDSSCNGVDDDCDGQVDENAIVFDYDVCNGRDDNCDGVSDSIECKPAEPPAGCAPMAEVCNTADDDCDGLFDEGDVCSLALDDTSLVGVWWECIDGQCAELRDSGLMFTNLASGEGARQGFGLKDQLTQPAIFDPRVHPYCGRDTFEYTFDPQDHTLTVRVVDHGIQNEFIGTVSATDMRATITWTKGPPDGDGTLELVRIAEHPAGFCPNSGGGQCAPNEICGNNNDDNCDGMTDNGCPNVCFVGENCGNNIDDDCDGKVDREDTECGPTACIPAPDAMEVCNGKDDNCDGFVDNLPGTCQVEGQLGECATGHYVCTPNGTACEPFVKPGLEYCDDGKDTDCDGQGSPDSPTTADDNEVDCQPLAAGEACFNATNINAGGRFPISFTGALRNETVGCDSGQADRVFTFTISQAQSPADVFLTVEGAGGAPNPSGSLVATLVQGSCANTGSDGFNRCFSGSTYNTLNAGTYFVIVRGSADSNGTLTFAYRSRSGMCDGPCACVPADGDGDSFTLCDHDCNDQNGAIHPQGTEICNGADDDCNGFVDDLAGTCSTGLSGICNYGSPSCQDSGEACGSIYQAGTEYCGDGLDSDCDGDADNNETGCDGTNVAGETCFGAVEVGVTGGTFQGTLNDANDDVFVRGCSMGGADRVYKFTVPALPQTRTSVVLMHGSANYGVDFTIVRDCPSLEVVQCLGASGNRYLNLEPGTYYLIVEGRPADYWFTLGFDAGEECLTPDSDGDGYTVCNGDCNELDPSIHVGSSEGTACDGLDNNCNGTVDDVVGVCTVQGQQGECAVGRLSCPASCQQVTYSQDSVEVCGDGLDNDCDGLADDAGEPGVDCTAPGVNGETCANAVDITAGGRFSSSLVGALDNAEFACGTTGQNQPEQYFRFTIGEMREVHIRVTGTSPSMQDPTHPAGEKSSIPYVLLGASCSKVELLGCGWDQTQYLPAGTYFVVVQGPGDLSFDLDLWSRSQEGGPNNCLPGDLDQDGLTMCDGDCLENNPNVHAGRWNCSGEVCMNIPAATEVCDGLDNDCDGWIDDLSAQDSATACETAFTGACGVGSERCVEGAMACVANVLPGVELEVCGNEQDDNCDGALDEQGCVMPDGESCARALDVSAGGAFPLNFATAGDNGEGCVPYPNNPELYFTFTLESRTTVHLVPVLNGTGTSNVFGVSLFNGACVAHPQGGALNGCAGNYGTQHYLEPGTYTVVVEGSPTLSGALQVAFGDGETCTPADGDGDGQTVCRNDCNDKNPGVYMGAPELCNNIDDNCDGNVDNLPVIDCTVEGTFGECARGHMVCSNGNAACEQQVFPNRELCGDGRDTDCDGQGASPEGPEETDCLPVTPGEMCFNAIDLSGGGAFDDSLINASNDAYGCYWGDSGDRYFRYTASEPGYFFLQIKPRAPAGTQVTLRTRVSTTCNDYNSQGEGYCLGSSEINGSWMNPGDTLFFMVEASQPSDFTLYIAQTVMRGDAYMCTVGGEPGGDFDEDGFSLCGDGGAGSQHDCAEDDGSIHPTVVELCNNRDDNCDGAIDNILSDACTTGQSGVCSQGHTECVQGASECVQNRQPSIEVCGDRVDNDCSGAADEPTCEVRPAGDTCELAINLGSSAVREGETLAGAMDDVYGCSPQAAEKLYRFTLDVSSYVSAQAIARDLSQPVHLAIARGDCGNLSLDYCFSAVMNSAWLNPGTYYVIVEGAPAATYDFYLGIDPGEATCTLADVDQDGYSICGGDCNEAAPAQHPGGQEICNGRDDNCDGSIDNPSGPCAVEGQLGECALGYITGCANGSAVCQALFAPSIEYCGDGKDTDCDGEGMNGEDPQCVIPLAGELCSNAIDVSTGGKFFADPQGTLQNRTDEAHVCGDAPDPDVFFKFSTNHSVYLYTQPIVVAGDYATLETAFYDLGPCGTPNAYCQYNGYSSFRAVSEGTSSFAVQGAPSTDFDLYVAIYDYNAWDEQTQRWGKCIGGPAAPNGDFDGDGRTLCEDDCNEADPTINGSAPEVCGDNKDNDCDGMIDDQGANCSVPEQQGVCAYGVISCEGRAGLPGICVQRYAPSTESCENGADDDCDGFTDRADRDCGNTCGDGVFGEGEGCDDGNMINGDGCSAQCQFEAPR